MRRGATQGDGGATRMLTEAAFKATSSTGMREITDGDHEAIDIWPYVEAIPEHDLEGLRLHGEEVKHVWRDAHDRYDQVMLPLARDNTYLVVVVDLRQREVHGHHVLDLGEFYGVASPGE